MVWSFKGSKKFMKRFGDWIYSIHLKRILQKDIYYRVHWKEQSINVRRWFATQIIDYKNSEMKLAPVCSSKLSDDETVIKILRYVHKHLNYVSDVSRWNVPEYWQTLNETANLRTGDCEDGACLIVALSRIYGISAERIFVQTGWVEYYNRIQGHAYVIYVGDDGGRYVLDWCWFYDPRQIKSRPMFFEQTNYKESWFLFNDKYSGVLRK